MDFQTKILDFSIARLKRQAMELATYATSMGGVQGPGTLAYMSPEVYHGSGIKRQPAADIYALGIILIEHANYGAYCYEQKEEVEEAMRKSLLPKGLSNVPENLLPLTERAVSKKPGRRPTAKEIGIKIGEMYNELEFHHEMPVW